MCRLYVLCSHSARPDLIRALPSFGYSTTISQLLTIPPYVSAGACFTCTHIRRASFMVFPVIMLIIFAIWSDRVKMRSPFLFAALLISLAGFVINISDAPIGAKYFGTFLCMGGLCAAFPGTVAWYGPPHRVLASESSKMTVS